jgi:hypothetical protein
VNSDALKHSAGLPPPAPPQGRSGCLTALYIVLGLGLVALVVLIVGGWLFLRSETGQQVMTTVREGVTLAQEASTAPGTEALRDAGCGQALVMSAARLRDVAGAIVTGLPEGAGLAGAERVLFCQASRGGDPPPACADLVRRYAGAVDDAPDRMAVLVQVAGQSDAACQGVYSPDGTFLAAFDSSGP